MFVCVCKGISDRQIKQAVARGAADLEAVSQSLGVATQCGSCAALANEIIGDTLADIEQSSLFYQVA